MFKRILACLDGSRFAEQILPYVVEEARRFASNVVLLQVIKMPRLFYASSVPIQPALSIPPTLTEEQIGAEETTAKSYLNSVALRLRETGLDVDCVTLIARLGGTIGDAIISYAAANEIGLIAMATRGYTGWKRLIFGSTADFVLKKSGLPVMAIKPQETMRQCSTSSKAREKTVDA
jgi:nucleotide-binding universal stress UspA family protein